MGRHSAAAPLAEAGELRPTGPVTDPRLFDRPLPPAPRRVETDRTAVADRPAMAFAAPAVDAAPALRPALVTPVTQIAPTEQPRSARVRDEHVVAGPTSSLPFDPVPVRSSAPLAGGPVVPQVSGASLLGRAPARPARQRYLRTGPVQIVTDEPEPAPVPFTRRRETALAAAALAVVGAMSGAAALLPSNTSDAQAATKADPVSAPMPTASGASDGVSCLSPLQLKRAMRQHHLRRTHPVTRIDAATVQPSVASNTRPSASASSSASASASPSATRTSASSSTGSTSGSSTSTGSGSGSSSTAPLRSLPGVVGALPLSPSSLGSGTYTLRDFVSQSSGAVISGGRLVGAGVGKTVVEMAKNTSTKAGSVPGNGNNQGGLANPVNPLYLLRGVSDLENVTVQGTEQGHLYNGLYMTGPNLVIKHVQINDIPGNSNANPGETFAVGVNRASGTARVDDLTINGGSGALSSAAGLAINNSDANWTIDNLTTTNLKYSAGIALWQVRGTMNIHNYVQKGGARSLGAERMAGTVNLYDPKWSAGTTGHDITYTWDGGYSGGSINFYYSSASEVPDRKIQVITNKASGIAASVHVYIGGVQQTASKYVTVN